MLTVKSGRGELKRFEGEWNSLREIENAVKSDPGIYKWKYDWTGVAGIWQISVWNHITRNDEGRLTPTIGDYLGIYDTNVWNVNW